MLVANAEDINRAYAREAHGAAERAIAAGAVPPLTYIGTGMTAHVFTDQTGLAFKVASHPTPYRNRALAEEAAWIKSAGRSKATRDMVPKFVRYDAQNQVIVREHVKGILPYGRHPKARYADPWMDEVAFKKFEELEPAMLRKGWSSPERKPESWAFDPEDPSKAKLFDAGMASMVGRRLVAHALRLIKEGGDRDHINETMVGIRAEALHWKSPTIRRDVAARLLQGLVARGGDPELARELPEFKQNPKKPSFKTTCQRCNLRGERIYSSTPCCGWWLCPSCIGPEVYDTRGTRLCRSCVRFREDLIEKGQATRAQVFGRTPRREVPPTTLATSQRPRGGSSFVPSTSSSPTFQEERMSVATGKAHRMPHTLMVSDMGTKGIPLDARPFFPSDVKYVHLVDAHVGYHDAERALLEAGFGHARSWHYQVLGIPEYFRDGEGHSVHRWMRLFKRGGKPGELVVWQGEGPASQTQSYAQLKAFVDRVQKDQAETKRPPAPPVLPPDASGQWRMFNPGNSIGRLVVVGWPARNTTQAAEWLTRTLKALQTHVQFLVGPGGFLTRYVPLGHLQAGWGTPANILEYFRADAAQTVMDVWKKVPAALRGKASYFSFGLDYRDPAKGVDQHAELVAVMDMRTGALAHLTGKSFPTQDQENTLLRVKDWKSHFWGPVLLMGCHDLNVFSGRGAKARRSGSDREVVAREFFDTLQKKSPPRVLLHHPHSTEVVATWVGGWAGAKAHIPNVEGASGISYEPLPYRAPDALPVVLDRTRTTLTADVGIEGNKEIEGKQADSIPPRLMESFSRDDFERRLKTYQEGVLDAEHFARTGTLRRPRGRTTFPQKPSPPRAGLQVTTEAPLRMGNPPEGLRAALEQVPPERRFPPMIETRGHGTVSRTVKHAIFKHKACGAVWRRSYVVDVVTRDGTTGRGIYARPTKVHEDNWWGFHLGYPGKLYAARGPFQEMCPTCGKGPVSGTPVHGKRTDEPCGAKCLAATGPNCECSCAGANHGAAHGGGRQGNPRPIGTDPARRWKRTLAQARLEESQEAREVRKLLEGIPANAKGVQFQTPSGLVYIVSRSARGEGDAWQITRLKVFPGESDLTPVGHHVAKTLEDAVASIVHSGQKGLQVMTFRNPRPLRECTEHPKIAVSGCKACDRGWQRVLAESRLLLASRAAGVRAVLKDLPGKIKGLHLEGSNGQVFIITPSVRGDHAWKGVDYPWQVSHFKKEADGSLTPWGHVNARTIQEAVEKASIDSSEPLRRIEFRNPREENPSPVRDHDQRARSARWFDQLVKQIREHPEEASRLGDLIVFPMHSPPDLYVGLGPFRDSTSRDGDAYPGSFSLTVGRSGLIRLEGVLKSPGNPEDMLQRLHAWKPTFIHEAQHYQDWKRTGYLGPGSQARRDRAGPRGSARADAAYHQSPEEWNAYYQHGWATYEGFVDLHRRSRGLQDRLPKISTWDYLIQNLSRWWPWTWLGNIMNDPKRTDLRKKFFRRLRGDFDHMQERQMRQMNPDDDLERSMSDWRTETSLDRGSLMRVLQALAHHEVPLTLRQVAQESGLSETTARKVLPVLVQKRWVDHLPNGSWKVSHSGREAVQVAPQLAAESAAEVVDYDAMAKRKARSEGVFIGHPMTRGPAGQKARTIVLPHPPGREDRPCKLCSIPHVLRDHRGHAKRFKDAPRYLESMVGFRFNPGDLCEAHERAVRAQNPLDEEMRRAERSGDPKFTRLRARAIGQQCLAIACRAPATELSRAPHLTSAFEMPEVPLCAEHFKMSETKANPGSDEALRILERRAQEGDIDALDRLTNEAARRGDRVLAEKCHRIASKMIDAILFSTREWSFRPSTRDGRRVHKIASRASFVEDGREIPEHFRNPAPARGNCYLDSFRFQKAQPNTLLVHGSVPYSKARGGRIPHAWVEISPRLVWEPQTRQYFTSPVPPGGLAIVKYTRAQAQEALKATKNYGPWDPRLHALAEASGVYTKAEMDRRPR